MGDWYSIGLAVGIGVALGVFLAGVLAGTPGGLLTALGGSLLAGAGAGFLIEGWEEALGGGAGGLLAAFGAVQLVQGSLRRGGTRGGTAALVGLVALLIAAIAFVPLAGYVEAVAVALLGARLRRRSGDRYAGLRILARD